MKIQKVSLVVLMMLTTFIVCSKGQNSRIIDSPRENNIKAVMEIVPGERIGPYTIGMSATEVSDALGEPDTIWEPPACDDFAYWIYRNESLSFHVRKQKVVGMTSLSPRHAIADGPQVGMHWEKAMDQWEQALGREIIGSMSDGASKTFYFISEFNLLLEMDASGIIREIGLEGAIPSQNSTFVLADEGVQSVILVTPTSVGDLDLGMSRQDFEVIYGPSDNSFRGGTAEYCIYSDISVIYDSRSDYQTIVGYAVLFRNDNLVLDLENATLTSKTTYQNFEEIFVDKEIKVRVAVSTKMIVGFKDYKFEFYKFGDDPEFYLREIEISSLY
jgi:hypothetical protein